MDGIDDGPRVLHVFSLWGGFVGDKGIHMCVGVQGFRVWGLGLLGFGVFFATV